jgi:hypothetical protein
MQRKFFFLLAIVFFVRHALKFDLAIKLVIYQLPKRIK